jgi:hypothetical protein
MHVEDRSACERCSSSSKQTAGDTNKIGGARCIGGTGGSLVVGLGEAEWKTSHDVRTTKPTICYVHKTDATVRMKALKSVV